MKRAVWSSLLAIPLALTVTGISDSTAVSDAFRYVVAPGTMLSVRLVRVEPTHSGLGVFLDALHLYTTAMSFAVLLNAIFYALVIFSVVTIISGLRRRKALR